MIGIFVGLGIFALGFLMFVCGGIVNAAGGDAPQKYFDITAFLGSISLIIMIFSGAYLLLQAF